MLRHVIKAPADRRIVKIAAGANVAATDGTEALRRTAGGHVDAPSLPYDTVPGGWPPQATIPADGARMVPTPTCHVFATPDTVTPKVFDGATLHDGTCQSRCRRGR